MLQNLEIQVCRERDLEFDWNYHTLSFREAFNEKILFQNMITKYEYKAYCIQTLTCRCQSLTL